MIFGAGDTHNSYGANRFRRVARKGAKITLFGGGEETRDHLYIEDAVALIELVIRHRSAGTLNLVSGRSIAFGDLARMVAGHFSPAAEIEMLPRQSAVTHRQFDAAAVQKAFPDFKPTKLEDAIAATHATGD
jgi:nucleoside-diphosphate-sugar epimerase